MKKVYYESPMAMTMDYTPKESILVASPEGYGIKGEAGQDGQYETIGVEL